MTASICCICCICCCCICCTLFVAPFIVTKKQLVSRNAACAGLKSTWRDNNNWNNSSRAFTVRLCCVYLCFYWLIEVWKGVIKAGAHKSRAIVRTISIKRKRPLTHSTSATPPNAAIVEIKLRPRLAAALLQSEERTSTSATRASREQQQPESASEPYASEWLSEWVRAWLCVGERRRVRAPRQVLRQQAAQAATSAANNL